MPSPPLSVPAASDLRQALRTHLLARGASTLVDEFWVPRSNERADLVAIRDRLEAFEIKSGRDRLNRLPRQVDAYCGLFDSCTAVVAERHLPAVCAIVPEWWGMAVIKTHDNAISFEWLRRAEDNPSVDGEILVRLLWREEVRNALVHLGAPPEAHHGRTLMWRHLLDRVDPQTLRAIVCEAIATRDPAAARMGARRFASTAVLAEC